ncbi:hypothetical protein, partial [Paracoccus binzhouensis]|uniref:hypothetical protein n=1 Tax=Paracoccus binzhouensis TaxID=2796149 RepID=UPI001E55B8FF
PRSRQRHDLYAKYHDYDSEISDLLGECGIPWLPCESLFGDCCSSLNKENLADEEEHHGKTGSVRGCGVIPSTRSV